MCPNFQCGQSDNRMKRWHIQATLPCFRDTQDGWRWPGLLPLGRHQLCRHEAQGAEEEGPGGHSIHQPSHWGCSYTRTGPFECVLPKSIFIWLNTHGGVLLRLSCFKQLYRLLTLRPHFGWLQMSESNFWQTRDVKACSLPGLRIQSASWIKLKQSKLALEESDNGWRNERGWL